MKELGREGVIQFKVEKAKLLSNALLKLEEK